MIEYVYVIFGWIPSAKYFEKSFRLISSSRFSRPLSRGTWIKSITFPWNCLVEDCRIYAVPLWAFDQLIVGLLPKWHWSNSTIARNALVAAEIRYDKVLPFFEAHDVRLLRILTDRSSEYCGNLHQHGYDLYLALGNIDHSNAKAKSPQTKGIR